MFEEMPFHDDDRGALADFVARVFDLIAAIAYDEYFERFDYPGDPIRFEDDDLALYRAAVDEFRDSGYLDRLFGLIAEMSTDVIVLHGLGGRQLQAKRVMVQRGEQRFLARPSGRLFRRFLQGIDVLLDSLLSAVPAGTALSELKDMAGLLPRGD